MKNRILLITLSVLFASFLSAQDKIKIEKAGDLPKHNYQLSESNLRKLIGDESALKHLQNKVLADLESDVNMYEFSDKSILKDYYDNIRVIALLQGDYDKALQVLGKTKELAVKEAERLVRACEFQAYAEAMVALDNPDSEALQQAIHERLADRIDTLPFNVIQEDIEKRKGRANYYSANLVLGLLDGELQSTVNNTAGNIPLDVAMDILLIKCNLVYYVPNTEIYSAVFTELINRKAVSVEKQNIWNERNVNFTSRDHYEKIVVGIWDSGVDIEVFAEDNKWRNMNEKPDGIDNDKNGYIDDIHGVGYDYEGVKTVDLLLPEALELENLDEQQDMYRGIRDMLANVESENAKAFKEKSAAMSAEEYEQFFEIITMLSIFNHGTHVAGIAVEGNPFAEILVARLTFDHKTIPDAPTMETAQRWGEMYIDVMNYFRENNVRVVNMSWSVDIRIDIIPALQKNGIGKNEEERLEIAKKMFAFHEQAFTKAMEATPDILFVTSAGNSNNDVDFAGSVPSSFNYPNILTVGAVDIEGKKTSFTTEGESVDVYANGYEVDSYVPGGGRMKMSGTSMSSPNVVNLAAKIFCVNPKLSAVEVKELIVNNATESAEDPNVLLIHPRNAVEAAKNARK